MLSYRCGIKASEPIVPFRETVFAAPNFASFRPTLPPPWRDTPGLSDASGGRVLLTCSTKVLRMTIQCCAIPSAAVRLLEVAAADGSLSDLTKYFSLSCEGLSRSLADDALALWKKIVASMRLPNDDESTNGDGNSSNATNSSDHFRKHFFGNDLSDDDANVLKRIVSFGPRECGCNVLSLSPTLTVDVWHGEVPAEREARASKVDEEKGTFGIFLTSVALDESNSNSLLNFEVIWSRLRSSVQAGFQAATAAGPLMQEPMHGVCFLVESMSVSSSVVGLSSLSAEGTSEVQSPYTVSDSSIGINSSFLSGALISEVRDALRVAMLASPVRVVEPIYACDLQCDQSQLGNLYTVLNKRRGTVTKEDIIEGTSLFLLSAHLPVYESFGFAQELLKKTSGSGTTPQLLFSHWSVNEADPFWKPTTAEELEDYGDQVPEPNLARIFIDKIRKRKGLPIEEKIVIHAEKQRTLTKMK